MIRRISVALLLLLSVSLCACSSDAPENEITSPSDLYGRMTGVIGGSPAQTYLLQAGLAPVSCDSYESLLSDLLSGRVDYAVADDITAKKMLSSSRKIRAMSGAAADEKHRFMAAPENPRLISDVNGAIEALASSGVFDELLDICLSGGEYPEPAKVSEDAATLTVAVDTSFYPYCWCDDGGTVRGLDVEAARAVCNQLGFGLTLIEAPSDKLLAAVQSGRASLAVVRMGDDVPEEQIVLTDVYLETSQVVLTGK